MNFIGWARREKALSCALIGIVLFLVGYFGGHIDERLHFALDILAFLAFGAAALLEKQSAPRMVWILLLVATVVFAQMDFKFSGQLTQPRSESTFEAR